MERATVILAWTFAPPDYFEQRIEVRHNEYLMTIEDGKAEARIAAEVFDRHPSIRQTLHEALNDRFLGAQLVTYRPYTLSKSTMVRIDPDGKQMTFIELEPISFRRSMGSLDFIMTDKEGNVTDSRNDRIEKKRSVGELIQKHRSTDRVLDALLRSHQAAVKDPGNELVYLYEIRDALSAKLGRTARNQLGITKGEWSRFGQLANDEPLRQGRHRGWNAGALRDATEGELHEARRIAKKLIESYLTLLQLGK